MKQWYPARAALTVGIVLNLGIVGSGNGHSMLSLAQPRPVYAGTVSGESRAGPDTTGCAGDCDVDGQVAIDEILRLVNIALGNDQADGCAGADVDHNQQITVDEIIAAVNNALTGCPPAPVPTATMTEVPTATPPALPTATPTVPIGGSLTVAQAVARYSNGVAIQLNQTVTTEGVVTVSPGVFANNKLKIFLQSEGAGIEVYNQTSANVPPGDFEATQRCRVTGVVRQADPAGGSDVLNGTVMVDVSAGSWVVLSSGNSLPVPQPATLHELKVNGIPYVGVVVQVAHVQKVAGQKWPAVNDKSTSVLITDDGGATQLPLRFQRFTITQGLVNELNTIGDGPFNVAGIAVQSAVDGNLLGNFEIWVRGAEDINP